MQRSSLLSRLLFFALAGAVTLSFTPVMPLSANSNPLVTFHG